MERADFEELGEQLRCPVGKHAREVGENMFRSNSNMIFKTMDELNIQPGSKILETGFGNGKHLSFLFEKFKHICYYGIDISEAMIAEASVNNIAQVKNNNAVFSLVKGDGILDFENNSFDYCFTVNTIYFWDNIQQHFNEICRVLKPRGKFAIAFIEKDFGEKLPFTQKGFVFHEIQEVEDFFKKAGFTKTTIRQCTEQTISKDRQHVTRPFVIMTGQKEK